jgi:hypothetical protein
MSLEAWGDGDDGHDGCVKAERAEEAFVEGLQAMREMLARFVEQGGDHATAASLRANWAPAWGNDPGKLDGELPADPWGTPISKASIDSGWRELK